MSINMITDKSKSVHILVLCVIAAVGFLIYSNSFQGAFICDDGPLIAGNIYIKNWAYLPKLFTENINAGSGIITPLYRPVLMLSIMLDYSLWKLDVRGYHIMTVFYHVLAACAVYGLINILYQDRLLSFLVSLFFVSHPIQVEDVAYITGRADSLALLFLTLSFIFYIISQRPRKNTFYILSITFFVLSVLSKENTIVYPALLLLYHYSRREHFYYRRLIYVFAAALAYIILRSTILQVSSPIDTRYFSSILERVPGFFVALCNYLALLAIPISLHGGYGHLLFSPFEPKALVGLGLFVLLCIYALRKRETNPLLLFGIGWFFITLLPVSNIFYIASSYMAERYLYIPSIGSFLIAGSFISRYLTNGNTRTVTFIFIAVLFSFYCYKTVNQNSYWRDPVRFYETTISYQQDDPGLYNMLGIEYGARGRTEEAVACFRKAINLSPIYTNAYLNLGNLYQENGNMPEALTLYSAATKLKPSFPEAYYNTGNIYRQMKRYKDAVIFYQKAIDVNPYYVDAYNNLGALYSDILNDKRGAIPLFKKAIEIYPDCAIAYYNLGTIYAALGMIDEAIIHYNKALAIKPDYVKACFNLSRLYADLGRSDEAEALYKKAKGLDPNLAENMPGLIRAAGNETNNE